MPEDQMLRTSLGFLPSVKAGVYVTGTVAEAPRGHPKDAYGGAVGKSETSSDIVTYGFHVKSNASFAYRTEIAVGVCDASGPVNAVHVGKAFGFHLGKARVIKSSHGHRLRALSKSLSLETPRQLPFSESGRIDIIAVVNMNTRRLSIAINENPPVDCGFTLPESVRPWVWFGGPGVGSVELAEYRIADMPPASSRLNRRPSHTLEKTRIHTPRSSAESTGPTEAPAPAPAAPKLAAPKPAAPKPAAVVDVSDGDPVPSVPLTMVTSLAAARSLPDARRDDDVLTESATDRESSLGDEPEAWTARAAAWLMPLQQLFHSEKDADLVA